MINNNAVVVQELLIRSLMIQETGSRIQDTGYRIQQGG